MNFTAADIQALALTFRLAITVTIILMMGGIPFAWWLTRTHLKLKAPLLALCTLPMILPPSVLGFYLLLAMGPAGPLGIFTEKLGLGTFAFSFGGLVVASCIHSLPFMLQPLVQSFEGVSVQYLEVAAMQRAGLVQQFFRVALPLSKNGILTAAVMTFAHTVGEFGVLLMIGGSIPGKTRVASVQIYDYVQAFEYAQAHRLALVLLLFAFSVMFVTHGLRTKRDLI
jgi:molybdate transport system permease protein